MKFEVGGSKIENFSDLGGLTARSGGVGGQKVGGLGGSGEFNLILLQCYAKLACSAAKRAYA